MIFGERLKQARNKAGLSQENLGIKIGIAPSSASPRINQYERNRHRPSDQVIVQLALALGVPTAFFYTEDKNLTKLILQCSQLEAGKQKTLTEYIEKEYGIKCCAEGKCCIDDI